MATTTTARTRKPKPAVRFETPADVPALAQAASVTIALLKFMQSNTLDELYDRASEAKLASQTKVFITRLGQVELSDDQAHLIELFFPVLRLITVKPGTTLAVCAECHDAPTASPDGEVPMPHGWQLVGSTSPSSCRVTAGCTGKPSRAVAAKKYEVALDEDAAEQGPSQPQAPAQSDHPYETLPAPVDFDNETAATETLVDFDDFSDFETSTDEVLVDFD